MNTRSVINTAFTSYPATGVQLPNGRQLTNTYDALYRRTLAHDQTNDVDVAAWQFFGPSRVAETKLGNGLICSWMDNARTNSAVQPSVANPAWGDQSSDRLGYDGAGRPITKRYLAGGINASTRAYNNPSAVVGFTTEYDLASNKFYERHLHAEERSHLYEPFSNGAPTGGYDSLNRLRQYQRGTLTGSDGFAAAGGGSVATPIALPNTDTQRTYDLDSLGNWRRTVFTPEGGSQETEVRQHNGLNEITRIQNGASQTNLTYDGAPGHSNGNLKNDGTRSYTWDALNRLVQVNRVSDGAVIGQYVYDALNRRIRKTVSNGGLSGTIPNGTTDCIYSGWRCVEERNPSGESGDTPMAQYIWGIYLDECLQQRLLVETNNFPANSDLYPLQDLLYRTTGLADSSGVVREAYDTDAYGNTLIFRNSGSPPGAIAFNDSDTQASFPTCPFIFTGQRFDAETMLYYYKRRIYSASQGRFISRDSLEINGGYLYAGGTPTQYIDALGAAPHTAEAVKGNVKWTFISDGKNRVGLLIKYIPSYDVNTKKSQCDCQKIAFVQVILSSTRNGTVTVGSGYPSQNLIADPSTGMRIDVTADPNRVNGVISPYMNAQWSVTAGDMWISNDTAFNSMNRLGSGHFNALLANIQDPNTGKPRVDAFGDPGVPVLPSVMGDTPQNLPNQTKVNFEAAAICVDSGEIFGCLKWGLQVNADGSSKLTQGDKDADFSKSCSGEFNKAMKQWNQVASQSRGQADAGGSVYKAIQLKIP